MTTYQFIQEYILSLPEAHQMIFKQFGKSMSNLDDIQFFLMNNHVQDWNNQDSPMGTGLRYNGQPSIINFDNLVDLKQYTFTNGVLRSEQLNPSVGEIDPGFNGIVWLDTFLVNLNLGTIYRHSVWMFYRPNWNDNEFNVLPKGTELYMPVDLFTEDTPIIHPQNSGGLTINELIERKLVFDTNNNDLVTATDLSAALPYMKS